MIENSHVKTSEAWVVRRCIRVPALAHPADAPLLERTLAEVDGVLRVAADPTQGSVKVDYLVTETDFQALEHALEMVGFPPAAGRWARLRSGWYQNLDLNGRANAAAPSGACCNKPPTRRH